MFFFSVAHMFVIEVDCGKRPRADSFAHLMFVRSEYPSPLRLIVFSFGVHFLVPKRHFVLCFVNVRSETDTWFLFSCPNIFYFCLVNGAFLIALHGKWRLSQSSVTGKCAL